MLLSAPKMDNRRTITLLTVTDTHYLPLAAALIKSVEANISPDFKLDFWVIADHIDEHNRTKLGMTVNASITNLIWKDAKEIVPANLRIPIDRSSFPANIFLRYFAPFFLPQNVDRIIYLDADMINCRNIGELWDTDLGSNAVAAVTDPRVKTFDCEWGGIRNYKELGLSGKMKYFNSGLLVINRYRWMEAKITEKTLKVVEDNLSYANYPDQYGANVALAGLWLELNTLWNVFADCDCPETPYNIHFVNRKPIYKSYKNNEKYLLLFRFYLQQTAWANMKQMSELSRKMKKIDNILKKNNMKV